MDDAGTARAAGEEAMAALAPEAGLFARLDPVNLAGSLLAVCWRAALNPVATSNALRQFGSALARIGPDAAGRWSGSEPEEPDPAGKPLATDKRFADPAWRENPVFFAIGQAYLAAVRLADDLLAAGRGDPVTDAKARLASDLLLAALAPTNYLATNPAALKRAFDTGGVSVARGARQWWRDVRTNGGMPSQTDRGAFSVGTDLAVTPGAVVDRDELAEVIQYRPSTPAVRRQPVLVIPPPIGRYYFLELRPGRSFVEYAVSRGLQVFMISWRNPDASMGGLGMDAYAARIRSAMATVSEICDSPELSTIGFCAGGILMSTVLAGASFDGRVAAASFAVTLLDFDSRAACCRRSTRSARSPGRRTST